MVLWLDLFDLEKFNLRGRESLTLWDGPSAHRKTLLGKMGT